VPERKPTRKPVVVVGSNVYSGTVNDGRVLITAGAARTYNVFSGVVGPDVSIHVGAGRLDGVAVHDSTMQALSGLAINLYDSALAISGGPIPASGHPLVFSTRPGHADTGISGAALRGHYINAGGVPFTSGLVLATRSGMPGCTVCYTPVVSGSQNIG